MTTENQTQTMITLEKIKAFAIGFIGAGIFSMGSTYFSEQASYNVPRILFPFYELFGNVGLAIGMLLLGTLIMLLAYKKFKKNDGKPTLFLIYLLIAVFVFYATIYATNKQPSTKEINQKAQEREQNFQSKIANSDRPKLDNARANAYLDKLEALHAAFQKSQSEHNKILFDASEKEYENLIGVEFSKVVEEIATNEKYRDFAMYNANVLTKINNLRVQNMKD